MECNKEDARRAKDLAEKKLQERDFAGAKRLVTKAIRLNPSLEGLSQMLPVINAHIVSEQIVGDGEMDWYGLLQVEPDATEATIKSQYKKFALLFHPDKNKSVCAESAFKLISDAWNVLSDKTKKLQHDSKRRTYRESSTRTSSCPMDQNRSSQQDPQTKPSTRNEERARSEALARMRAEEERMEAEGKLEMEKEKKKMEKKKMEREQKKEREKMTRRKAQELKAESERNKKPRFRILEGSPGPPESDLPEQLKEDSEQIFQASELSQLEHPKRRMFQRQGRETRAQRREAAVRVVDEDTKHEQVQDVNSRSQQVHENIQAQQVSRGLDMEQAGKRKKKSNQIGDPKEENCCGRKARNIKIESHVTTSLTDQKVVGDENHYPLLISREVLNLGSIFAEYTHDHLDVATAKETPLVTENLPAVISEEAAKLEETVSIDGQNGGSKDSELAHLRQDPDHEENLPLRGTNGINAQSPTGEDERRSLRAEILLNGSKITVQEAQVTTKVSTRTTRSMLKEKGKQVSGTEEEDGNIPRHDHAQVNPNRSYSGEVGLQHLEGELLEVLPSQFFDFDDVRTRQAFRVGQIWAVYDDKDGMPRFYCRLTRVSRSPLPFKAKFSWLEPTVKTERKHSHFLAQSNSFAVACGEFEAGEDSVTEYINIFSHCVSEKLKEDPVKIYPLKGETWAIYANWNQKLRAPEGEDIKQPYDLVEILEDYSEEQGAAAVRLVQAPGFRSVFHRQEGPDAFQCFLPSQLPAFSHRILSGKVSADVKLGLSGESWEVDPASLPESMIIYSTP